MARKLFRWLGGQLINLGLDAVLALLVTVISLQIGSDPTVFNWALFILTWAGAVAFLQIIGRFFLWLGDQWVYLSIAATPAGVSNRCNIEITNGYDEDLTELRIELKSLWMVGYPTNCWIQNERPFFSTGLRIDSRTIKPNDTATVFIAEIPVAQDAKYLMEILIEGGWKSTYLFADIAKESEEQKERLGTLSGTMFEGVLEITGKVEGRYIKPQFYRMRLLYLLNNLQGKHEGTIQWMRLDRHSSRKEQRGGQSTIRPDKEVIRYVKEDFWIFYDQMIQGKDAEILRPKASNSGVIRVDPVPQPAFIEDKEAMPSISLNAPYTLRGPSICSFLVKNEGPQEKLKSCYAKIEVVEVHRKNGGAVLRTHPLSMYPKNIRWQSGKETIVLRKNDTNFLHVLELGQHNFRLLFHGDSPLPEGITEPEDLPRGQTEWLSHKHYIIRISLFGDDEKGKSFEIKREFALNFMVLDNQYTRNIKARPLSPCVMKIKEIISHDNIEDYFKWERD